MVSLDRGTGDGLSDSREVYYALNESRLPSIYFDEVPSNNPLVPVRVDAIRNVLLDPDSDGDGVLDGDECLQSRLAIVGHGPAARACDAAFEPFYNPNPTPLPAPPCPSAYNADSDYDELGDGNESTLETNQCNPDTDGDLMPDGYEVAKGFSPRNPADGLLDPDQDGLQNWEEYCYPMLRAQCEQRTRDTKDKRMGVYWGGTDPLNPDVDNDLLCDGGNGAACAILQPDSKGERDYETNATDPDTDDDIMPDGFEAKYGLKAVVGDAWEDADRDNVTNATGSVVFRWVNRDEYCYQAPWRPCSTERETREAWVRANGPYWGGTNPKAWSTDGDCLGDGYEVWDTTAYDPKVPDANDTDLDQDGLTGCEEQSFAILDSDPDSDDDGLCDGGRAENCFFPGGTLRNQPGEMDYGSTPWLVDSDADGLSDGAEAQRWDPAASGTALDADADLLGGVIDSDSDNDGVTDGQEVAALLDPSDADTDNDGLTDGDEIITYRTIPKDSDTDDDGLNDAEEVKDRLTNATRPDTDADGLNDGNEVNLHKTDPLRQDTDLDGMPDGWEVQHGLQPTVDDAALDKDADDVSNIYEYRNGTRPDRADTDGDGMPDGWELRYGLVPWSVDSLADKDADGLSNRDEHQQGTSPIMPDADGDGLADGAEVHTYRTAVKDADSDDDNVPDGLELERWNAIAPSAWTTNYDGDAFANNLLDSDSDNDGLTDREEFFTTNTKPHMKDSDADGITDYDEVFVFQGKFDPNNPDTDGDGRSDFDEAVELNNGEDTDNDGISNWVETNAYATNPNAPDTDCDGVKDGPELNFWRGISPNAWQLNYDADGVANNLLDADSDSDDIKDGVEIGTVTTPDDVFYKTRPEIADTDMDMLRDGQEARNNVDAGCGSDGGAPGGQSAPSSQALPAPLPGPSVAEALQTVVPSLATGGILFESPDGLIYGFDNDGLYIQGGYGVRLRPVVGAQADGGPLGTPEPMGPWSYTTSSSQTGWSTIPTKLDTDRDGLGDGLEALTHGTNPGPAGQNGLSPCDSDGDGLGDGLEKGVGGAWLGSEPCLQRDQDPSTTTNPLDADTDDDGRSDGDEDVNTNGRFDASFNGYAFEPTVQGLAGLETNPADGDTDDDGIADATELLDQYPKTSPLAWDSDADGLSDGLETGVTIPIAGTNTANMIQLGAFQWPTWQPFLGVAGVTTNVEDFDSDDDGILDGLEDLNHNGQFGDWNSALNATELDAKDPDSDDDGLLDGRELLIYGEYTFQEAASRWGGSWQDLVFDASNPWETDPRLADTEDDGTRDGRDLNPRANAIIGLKFDKIQLLEEVNNAAEIARACLPLIIEPCDGWTIELYFKRIEADLPFVEGDWVLEMPRDSSIPVTARYPEDVPLPHAEAFRVINKPAGIAWTATRNGRILELDIPDDIQGLDPNDLDVVFRVEAKDQDLLTETDDTLDLSHDRQSFIAQHRLRLLGDALGKLENPNLNPAALTKPLDLARYYFVNANKPVDWTGDRDMRWLGFEDDVDAILKLDAGDNAPAWFLSGLDAAGVRPIGTCLGSKDCVK